MDNVFILQHASRDRTMDGTVTEIAVLDTVLGAYQQPVIDLMELALEDVIRDGKDTTVIPVRETCLYTHVHVF